MGTFQTHGHWMKLMSRVQYVPVMMGEFLRKSRVAEITIFSSLETHTLVLSHWSCTSGGSVLSAIGRRSRLMLTLSTWREICTYWMPLEHQKLWRHPTWNRTWIDWMVNQNMYKVLSKLCCIFVYGFSSWRVWMGPYCFESLENHSPGSRSNDVPEFLCFDISQYAWTAVVGSSSQNQEMLDQQPPCSSDLRHQNIRISWYLLTQGLFPSHETWLPVAWIGNCQLGIGSNCDFLRIVVAITSSNIFLCWKKSKFSPAHSFCHFYPSANQVGWKRSTDGWATVLFARGRESECSLSFGTPPPGRPRKLQGPNEQPNLG